MTYVPATASDLKARYPAFTAVADETVTYWLDDARSVVDASWCEGERAKAELALAAHNMALQGYGTAGGAVGDLAAMGVTSFKSASMSVSFADSVISKGAAGGYGATKYGTEFRAILRRCKGGIRLVGWL